MADKRAKDRGGKPEVAEQLREEAEEAGLPMGVAEAIIDAAVSEGVAPDKVEEVAEEAIRVEAEDRRNAKAEERPDHDATSNA